MVNNEEIILPSDFKAEKEKCHSCDVEFDMYDLQIHSLKCKTICIEDNTRCDLCDKNFENPQILNIHNLEIHKNKKGNNTCERCKKNFRNASTLHDHITRVHENLRKHKCDFCVKSFKTYPHLKRHTLNVHNEEVRFHCDNCNEYFLEKAKLCQHIKDKHPEINMFKCNFCNKEFENITKHTSHMRKVHNDKTSKDFSCHICNNKYSRRYHLKKHITGGGKKAYTSKL